MPLLPDVPRRTRETLGSASCGTRRLSESLGRGTEALSGSANTLLVGSPVYSVHAVEPVSRVTKVSPVTINGYSDVPAGTPLIDNDIAIAVYYESG